MAPSPDPARGDIGIGPLLTGVRRARGLSQRRLAEALCRASGTDTVSRHEISRWEREERLPTAYWLGYLGQALGLDVALLSRAAAWTRAVRETRRAAGRSGPVPDGWRQRLAGAVWARVEVAEPAQRLPSLRSGAARLPAGPPP